MANDEMTSNKRLIISSRYESSAYVWSFSNKWLMLCDGILQMQGSPPTSGNVMHKFSFINCQQCQLSPRGSFECWHHISTHFTPIFIYFLLSTFPYYEKIRKYFCNLRILLIYDGNPDTIRFEMLLKPH